MLKLIVVATMLGGTGVSLDKPLVKVDGGVKLQSVDAGVDPEQVIQDRRTEFKKQIMLLFNARANTRVKSILWSTGAVSTKTDGAIVILDANGTEIGLFFYYREGSWKTIPDDFK